MTRVQHAIGPLGEPLSSSQEILVLTRARLWGIARSRSFVDDQNSGNVNMAAVLMLLNGVCNLAQAKLPEDCNGVIMY